MEFDPEKDPYLYKFGSSYGLSLPHKRASIILKKDKDGNYYYIDDFKKKYVDLAKYPYWVKGIIDIQRGVPPKRLVRAKSPRKPTTKKRIRRQKYTKQQLNQLTVPELRQLIRQLNKPSLLKYRKKAALVLALLLAQ